MYLKSILIASCFFTAAAANDCTGDWSCSAKESADKDMATLLQSAVRVHPNSEDAKANAAKSGADKAVKAHVAGDTKPSAAKASAAKPSAAKAAVAKDATAAARAAADASTAAAADASTKAAASENAGADAAADSKPTAAASGLVVKTRPGLATKTTDKVTFGILLKKWYGISESKGEASADAVITLHWTDPRVKDLLPAGAPSMRLSGEEARSKMWLPDVVVTNVAHGGNDIISSSVKINSDGSVIQVDRVLISVKQSIQTKDFPFDSQAVHIKVASATYMSDEVSLVPIEKKSEWGHPTDTNIFSNSIWHFKEDSMKAFDESDGELKKSRGVLTLVVKRGLAEFISSVFMPSAVFLFVTWSAFWLPLGGPYTMPRIALNAFALLCQVSVSQMADRKIPDTGDRAWMTEYLGLCIQLQFALALINVLIITIENKQDGHALAVNLNDRMIMSYPISTSLNIATLTAGYVNASRCLIGATLFFYLAYVSLAYKWHHKSQEIARQEATPRDAMKNDAQ